MKRTAILYNQHTPLVDAVKSKAVNADCFTAPDFNPAKYDLIIAIDYNDNLPFNVLTSHLSLLPSFRSSEPVKEAFMAGVKVTGVTVYYTKPEKILAQYPVFIYNSTHYDELKQELEYIEQALFPAVVEKILNNEPFESRTLLGNSCGGCKGCSK